MRTRAEKKGDRYILNGEKSWISLADVADHFIVIAWTDAEKKKARARPTRLGGVALAGDELIERVVDKFMTELEGQLTQKRVQLELSPAARRVGRERVRAEQHPIRMGPDHRPGCAGLSPKLRDARRHVRRTHDRCRRLRSAG